MTNTKIINLPTSIRRAQLDPELIACVMFYAYAHARNWPVPVEPERVIDAVLDDYLHGGEGAVERRQIEATVLDCMSTQAKESHDKQ